MPSWMALPASSEPVERSPRTNHDLSEELSSLMEEAASLLRRVRSSSILTASEKVSVLYWLSQASLESCRTVLSEPTG
jgi:hypothetical protein